jgi:hypothetical protein
MRSDVEKKLIAELKIKEMVEDKNIREAAQRIEKLDTERRIK